MPLASAAYTTELTTTGAATTSLLAVNFHSWCPVEIRTAYTFWSLLPAYTTPPATTGPPWTAFSVRNFHCCVPPPARSAYRLLSPTPAPTNTPPSPTANWAPNRFSSSWPTACCHCRVPDRIAYTTLASLPAYPTPFAAARPVLSVSLVWYRQSTPASDGRRA